jgi:hypothetical protein
MTPGRGCPRCRVAHLADGQEQACRGLFGQDGGSRKEAATVTRKRGVSGRCCYGRRAQLPSQVAGRCRARDPQRLCWVHAGRPSPADTIPRFTHFQSRQLDERAALSFSLATRACAWVPGEPSTLVETLNALLPVHNSPSPVRDHDTRHAPRCRRPHRRRRQPNARALSGRLLPCPRSSRRFVLSQSAQHQIRGYLACMPCL